MLTVCTAAMGYTTTDLVQSKSYWTESISCLDNGRSGRVMNINACHFTQVRHHCAIFASQTVGNIAMLRMIVSSTTKG